MGKATESELGELHGAVARALTEVIENGIVVGTTGEDNTPIKAPAPAAYLVAALAMLKQNNITADPSTNKGLADLSARLAAKRKEGKAGLSTAVLDAAIQQLETDMGGVLQ